MHLPRDSLSGWRYQIFSLVGWSRECGCGHEAVRELHDVRKLADPGPDLLFLVT